MLLHIYVISFFIFETVNSIDSHIYHIFLRIMCECDLSSASSCSCIGKYCCCFGRNLLVCLRVIWRHVRRVLMWRLVNVKLTNYESKIMSIDELNISPSRQQRYEAWRRSLMMIAIPSVTFSTIFKLQDLSEESKIARKNYNTIGLAMFGTSAFATILFFCCTYAALHYWNQYDKSARIISIGWVGSLILSTWFLTLPVDFIYREEYLKSLEQVETLSLESMDGERLKRGISYSIQVLPLIMTTPMGMVKGALRIKGLLPETNLAGWFIVAISPFFSLVVLSSTIMIAQLGADSLFLTGIGLILIAPMISVFQQKLYTATLTERLDCILGWTQWSIGMITNLGFILLIVWANKKKLLPDTASIAQFVFELIGRSFITNVFFSDTLFRITICHMLCNRKAMNELDLTEMEELMTHYIPRYPEYQPYCDSTLALDPAVSQEDEASFNNNSNHRAQSSNDQARPSYEP
jgi:hypothetical protein